MCGRDRDRETETEILFGSRAIFAQGTETEIEGNPPAPCLALLVTALELTWLTLRNTPSVLWLVPLLVHGLLGFWGLLCCSLSSFSLPAPAFLLVRLRCRPRTLVRYAMANLAPFGGGMVPHLLRAVGDAALLRLDLASMAKYPLSRCQLAPHLQCPDGPLTSRWTMTAQREYLTPASTYMGGFCFVCDHGKHRTLNGTILV